MKEIIFQILMRKSVMLFIRQELEKLYRDKAIDEHQYNYFLVNLINSIDKHANIASVYGAFLKS